MSTTSLASTPRTKRSERLSADQSKVRICSALKLVRGCGDYRRAEMVKAFLAATEYRQRFGRP